MFYGGGQQLLPKAALESVDWGAKRCLALNWMLFLTLEPKFLWGASATNYVSFPVRAAVLGEAHGDY